MSTPSRVGDVIFFVCIRLIEVLAVAVIVGLIVVLGGYALDWLLQVRR